MAEKPDYAPIAAEAVENVETFLRLGNRSGAIKHIAAMMGIAFLDGDIAGSRETFDKCVLGILGPPEAVASGHASDCASSNAPEAPGPCDCGTEAKADV
jgi:hypothetical protein